MIIEEKLKKYILDRYKSIRVFSSEIGVPYTTVDSIFKRGISKANVLNIIKICNSLGIQAEPLLDGKIVSKQSENAEETNPISEKINQLSDDGQMMLNGIAEEILKYERMQQSSKKLPDNTKFAEDIHIHTRPIPLSYLPASAGTGAYLDSSDYELIDIPDTKETKQANFAVTVSGDSMEPEYYDGDIVLVKQQPAVDIGEIGVFIFDGEGYIKKLGKNELISLNQKYKPISTKYGELRTAGKVIGKL